MHSSLENLAEAIESIQSRGRIGEAGPAHLGAPGACLSTAWPQIDLALGGGLARGSLHEWFAQKDRGRWFPPMAIFIHLAWRAIEENLTDGPLILWIGRSCWPNPRALIRVALGGSGGSDDRALLARSLLIDPPDDAARMWAIDLSLRSSAVALVAADGARLDMAATRRLQLAAEAGRSLLLLARPHHEINELSAAATRWVVRPGIEAGAVAPTLDCRIRSRFAIQDQSSTRHHLESQISDLRFRISDWRSPINPRWIVQLLRCKGVRPTLGPASDQPCWALEWNGAKGLIHLATDVVDRPGSKAPAAESIALKRTA